MIHDAVNDGVSRWGLEKQSYIRAPAKRSGPQTAKSQLIDWPRVCFVHIPTTAVVCVCENNTIFNFMAYIQVLYIHIRQCTGKYDFVTQLLARVGFVGSSFLNDKLLQKCHHNRWIYEVPRNNYQPTRTRQVFGWFL